MLRAITAREKTELIGYPCSMLCWDYNPKWSWLLRGYQQVTDTNLGKLSTGLVVGRYRFKAQSSHQGRQQIACIFRTIGNDSQNEQMGLYRQQMATFIISRTHFELYNRITMPTLLQVTQDRRLVTLYGITFGLAFVLDRPNPVERVNCITSIQEDYIESEEICEQYFQKANLILTKVKDKDSKKKWRNIKLISMDISKEDKSSLLSQQFGQQKYGMDLYDSNRKLVGYVMNLFRLEDVKLWVCDIRQSGPSRVSEIQVFNEDRKPVGLVISYMGLNILISYGEILGTPRTLGFQIEAALLTPLGNTCYIYNNNSYCTGIRTSGHKILTVKHIVSQTEAWVGYALDVYLFPYTQKIRAKISKVIDVLDAIQIEIQGTNLQPQLKTNHVYSVGDKTIALGFGQFAFGKINRKDIKILPTISKGIISKSIQFKGRKCFIRFDGSLSRGFSGGGLWTGQQLAGMSVFNLKKQESQLSRINFSYSISLITGELSAELRQFISKVSRFNLITRTTVPHLPRL